MKLPMHLPFNKNIIANARKLRNNMTEEESKLWYQYLCNYPMRFMRQRIIDSFILDFYCAKCKLGIELDGNQHLTPNGKGHDEARTKLLNAYGILLSDSQISRYGTILVKYAEKLMIQSKV